MTRNKVIFDLDGVLRDLSRAVFGQDPPYWHHKDCHGDNIFEVMEKYPGLLITAPPTQYLRSLTGFDYITVVTNQVPWWIPNTSHWMRRNICYEMNILYGVIYTTDPEEKLELCKENDKYIVEDSPKLSCYDRVILVDRPYNRHVKCPIRVHSPKELHQEIRRINESV